jgi:hypothetical protein
VTKARLKRVLQIASATAKPASARAGLVGSSQPPVVAVAPTVAIATDASGVSRYARQQLPVVHAAIPRAVAPASGVVRPVAVPVVSMQSPPAGRDGGGGGGGDALQLQYHTLLSDSAGRGDPSGAWQPAMSSARRSRDASSIRDGLQKAVDEAAITLSLRQELRRSHDV